jgi:hypothetical protein
MKRHCIAFVGSVLIAIGSAAAADRVSFESRDGSLAIAVDGRPFATYVWRDPKILRPYFAHVRAPNGMQVTRNHPPVEGQDAADHAEMHPGLWMAFGDVLGADFWRNKAKVEHVEFVDRPMSAGDTGLFAVRNRYVADGKTICDEVSRFRIRVTARGTLLDWEATFQADREFYFGDQEEMGLGVRVGTNINVKNYGQIINSDGQTNEKQVWGKQADWCDYNGTIDGQQVGVLLMADPKNFRRPWFHARDYGLLVANPFGQQAFSKAQGQSKLPAGKLVVAPGQSFRLHFGVLVHSGQTDLDIAYREWLAGNK